jgi:hypothetical protein
MPAADKGFFISVNPQAVVDGCDRLFLFHEQPRADGIGELKDDLSFISAHHAGFEPDQGAADQLDFCMTFFLKGVAWLARMRTPPSEMSITVKAVPAVFRTGRRAFG